MVYPHFLKFLHNVELENVFPLLAEEFGRRLQAPPDQAEKKAMRRGAAWPPETFIAEPALHPPLFLPNLLLAAAWLPLRN